MRGRYVCHVALVFLSFGLYIPGPACAETVVNSEYGFSIRSPAGWDKQENIFTPFGTHALLFYSKGGDPYPAIAVTQDSILPFPDVKSVMDFSRLMAEQLRMSGLTIYGDPTYTRLAESEATTMLLSYPTQFNGERVDILWYQVMKDNTVFTLSLTDIESRISKTREVFDRMLESFTFSQ